MQIQQGRYDQSVKQLDNKFTNMLQLKCFQEIMARPRRENLIKADQLFGDLELLIII